MVGIFPKGQEMECDLQENENKIKVVPIEFKKKIIHIYFVKCIGILNHTVGCYTKIN